MRKDLPFRAANNIILIRSSHLIRFSVEEKCQARLKKFTDERTIENSLVAKHFGFEARETS